MMLFTNEYTILLSKDGGEDVVLKPGIVNAFKPFAGKFIPTAHARIHDVESKNIVITLLAGQLIDGVGIITEEPASKKAKRGKND